MMATIPSRAIRALDIVPETVLQEKVTITGTGFLGDREEELASMLDGYLRRLARREALLRRLIGRLARPLARKQLFHALGFSRLGDYTRERLGVSPRELQSLATVEEKLETLPCVARAFAEADLNWTKVRLLCGVADPSTEQDWVGRARQMTTRELEREIRRRRRCAAEPEGGSAAEADGRSTAGANGSDDPSEMGARGLLKHVDPAADPFSASPVGETEPRAVFRLRCPVSVRVLWSQTCELASRASGSLLAPWQAAETIAAEALSGASPPGIEASQGPREDVDDHRRRFGSRLVRVLGDVDDDSSWLNARSSIGGGLGGLTNAPMDVDAQLRRILTCRIEDDRVLEALPAELERLAEASEHSNAQAVDAALRALHGAMQRLDAQAGSLLALFFDRRMYYQLGFESSSAYIRERLTISVSKARALVGLSRRLGTSGGRLEAAYRQGRLSWLRALALWPVLDEQNAEAWIEHAGAVTYRRLVEDVEAASIARDLDPTGRSVCPADLDEPEVQMRAQLPTASECSSDAPADCEISFVGPEAAVRMFSDTVAAFALGADEPPWRALERLLNSAKRYWESLPSHRDPIFERDGWRCSVPACSSRRNLHDHHVVFRSAGGSNHRDNRVSVCAWHHLRGIHSGIVRATGTVSGGIVWELGARGHDRRPLIVCRDDRYIEPATARGEDEAPPASSAAPTAEAASAAGAAPAAGTAPAAGAASPAGAASGEVMAA